MALETTEIFCKHGCEHKVDTAKQPGLIDALFTTPAASPFRYLPVDMQKYLYVSSEFR